MIQKCSIENMNSNMHYFGIIILAIIVCIVFIYYIKITLAEHQEIVEKYAEKESNPPYFKTEYLGDNQEEVHNYDAKVIDTTFPTLNNLATSSATLRPCQIHFNKDGTNKYVFEDGWKEMDEIKTGENDIYKVPYKIFGNNFSNDNNFINFTETSKCFKKKNSGGEVNTYKYKSNDLVKYNLNSYVKIKETGGGENEYIQMNFVKQDANSVDNYQKKTIETICSYRYNPKLNLQDLNLYRFKINNVDNNIEKINKVSINELNNNLITIDNSLDYSELLKDNGSLYEVDSSGKISYTMKGFNGDNFVNIRIYKFNRNMICNDEITSYEIYNKQVNTGLLIETSPFTDIISNANIFEKIRIREEEKNEIIRLEKLLNLNNFKENIDEYANAKLSNSYILKEQLLADILHNIYKLIAVANISLSVKYITELNNKAKKNIEKNNFLNSINTIDKLIKVYINAPIPSQLPIIEKIIDIGKSDKKLIYKNCIGVMNYNEANILLDRSSKDNNIELVSDVKTPIYETKIYTIDTANKTIKFEEDTICEILLVGGGGGGGKNGGCEGGGGGGGGMIVHLKNFKLKANITYKITVGHGGAKSPGEKSDTMFGSSGEYTIISTLDGGEYVRADGGGGGGPGKSKNGETWGDVWAVPNAANGGSGGGGSAFGGGGGSGYKIDILNANSVFGDKFEYKVYGNDGGGANHLGGGGGGGGAGSKGAGPNGNNGGNGGDGVNIPMFDNNYYGAGGGGSTGNSCQGNWGSATGHPAGKGGRGGGGDGGMRAVTNGKDGMPHTGSGGGGSSYEYAGNGGSGIVIIKYIKKTRLNGARNELIIDYNEDTRTKYEIVIKKSTIVRLDDSKQIELSEGNYMIIKNTAYKKGFIFYKKRDAKTSSEKTQVVIHSNELFQFKISSIGAEEEYLNKITDNKDYILDSRALIKSVVIDNNIMLNIGSKGTNYKKLNIILSYLSDSDIDILNIIKNIKIEYTTAGSDKRNLLSSHNNYNIFNIYTDTKVTFQKTTSFDIVFKSNIAMDKIYMFLPVNKFYILNHDAAFSDLSDYSKYLANKMNNIEFINNIDKLFNIDNIDKNLNDLMTKKTYAITNENYKIEIKNNPDSNNGIALLNNVYNKILDYNPKKKNLNIVFKKADILTIFEESISDIKSKYISYESPNPRTVSSVEEKYNIDKVSDNYIYFLIN